MNDDEHTIESGFLEVSGGHKIYFQRWGNPKARPIFYLHGGPGSASKDRYKVFFDPKIHQVIFHDQRGSGQSTPFGSIENNTTQDLVADIESLRAKFGFEKISLAGGSWGSCLALVYGITHPKNVEKMLLWGIFTGTKTEVDYIQQGGLKTHFPEAWQQYIEVVPKEFQDNTVKYYIDKIQNSGAEEHKDYVRRWVILEASAMSIDGDYATILSDSKNFDESTRTLALLEAHYFINNCFLEDNFIKNNVALLANIPIVMIHGRFDHVCPPKTAVDLANKIGKSAHLQLVPGSHAREGSLRETLKAYAWSWL